MSDDLPAPLTPPDCDLRDLDGFMLNVERLFASELWALATGEEFKAALALWCRAWKQVPAGSLASDVRIIAAFAGMAKEPLVNRHWHIVMRGFVKCSDGRWYHKTLCEDALRAWDMKRRRAGERKADADRLKRWRDGRGNANETPIETRSETPRETASETRTKRVGQGQGQGQGQRKQEGPLTPTNGSHVPAAVFDPLKTGMADMVTVDGHPTINGFHVDIVFESCCRDARVSLPSTLTAWQPVCEWLRAGYTSGEILWLIRRIAARPDYKPPRTLAFFNRPIREDCRTGDPPNGKSSWHE